MSVSWPDLFSSLDSKKDLTPELASFVMTEILEGRAEKEDIKKFLTLLNDKGYATADIALMVGKMFEYAAPITITERAVDPVGTGGDGRNTINISTTSAIVTTAAGARVVKHGSGAASSKSGAADVLDALGVVTTLTGPQIEESVRLLGIGFLRATTFHPALRHAVAARKELAVPSIFNILGPLANPAKPKAIALGVARASALPLMAKVIADRGGEGFAFRSNDGLDEIALSDFTQVLQINDGEVSAHIFDPQDLGIARAPISELVGGEPAHNAAIIKDVLQGKKGAPREAILLNSAITIAAFKADFSLGVTQQIANGYVLAEQAIDSGRAFELLEKWKNLTNELAATAPTA